MKDHKDLVEFLKEIRTFVVLGTATRSDSSKLKQPLDQMKLVNKIDDLIKKYERESK
jgi:hypothetical protein